MEGSQSNKMLVLRTRPSYKITEQNFMLISTPSTTLLDQDQVLVKTELLSVSPSLRLNLNDVKFPQNNSDLGGVIPAYGVGKVEKSNHKGFSPGDLVYGKLGTQEYSLMYAQELTKLEPGTDTAAYLSIFGLEGLAAYFGFKKYGHLKPEETVVVSSAAGGVGSIAVQLAKSHGCKVVGITSSDEKCNYVTQELKADACINRRTTKNIREDLVAACPKGVDVFVDLVGGDIFNAVIDCMNDYARVIFCGSISSYNPQTEEHVFNIANIAMKQVRVEGYNVLKFANEFPQARDELKALVAAGKLKHRSQMVSGLEQLPRAMGMQLRGTSFGKMLLQVQSAPRL